VRCKAARADWCGALALGRCGSADITRCGAVRVDRCRDATVSGCGTVAVRRGKVSMVEMGQQVPPDFHEQTMMCQQGEPVLATPVAVVAK